LIRTLSFGSLPGNDAIAGAAMSRQANANSPIRVLRPTRRFMNLTVPPYP
jgi:hypothetical protein